MARLPLIRRKISPLRLLNSVVLLTYRRKVSGYLLLLCATGSFLHRPAAGGQQEAPGPRFVFSFARSAAPSALTAVFRLSVSAAVLPRRPASHPTASTPTTIFPHRYLCRKNDHGIDLPPFASFYAYRRQKKNASRVSLGSAAYISPIFLLQHPPCKKQPTTVIDGGIQDQIARYLSLPPIFIPKKPNTIFGIVMMMRSGWSKPS